MEFLKCRELSVLAQLLHNSEQILAARVIYSRRI